MQIDYPARITTLDSESNTVQNCKEMTLQAGQVALVDAQHYILKSTFEKV